jgi:hypothetical protein
LTGLGATKFSTLIENIYDIQHVFERSLPHNSMEEWVPGYYETFEALDMGNRYFTDRRDINGDTPISFGTEIDPHNILTNALSNEFVHLQENKVEYYEAQQGTDNALRSAIEHSNNSNLTNTLQILRNQPNEDTSRRCCGSASILCCNTA